ncbi:MAG: glycoside hydrolase family 11 protein, partial [Oscillospiraceae bacterium]|nr:glycoside hydrolase family 11 protein [Oscillospiraceae bacterium]
MKKRSLAILVAVTLLISIIPVIPSKADEITLTSNKTGNHDGYDYEFWTDVTQGSSGNKATMILTGAGSFKSDYDTLNDKNTLMRTGKKWGTTSGTGQLPSYYENIICEYDVDYQPGPKGASYMCVYGWTRKDNNAPLVEFYIVDDWGEWRPPGSGSKGDVVIGGITYEIFETTRVNQPSILGVTTFQQYWSVRKTKPTRGANGNIKGTINVSDHFKAWEAKSLKMGSLYEVSLCIEGYNSTGKADVKKHVLTWGGAASTTVSGATEAPKTLPPLDPNGYFFHSTFEGGSTDLDGWGRRGDATVANTSAQAFAGSRSLYVSGRTDTWHGVSRTLDTNVFSPGNSYSFSAMTRYTTGAANETFKLTLQYDGSDGTTHYDQIATGIASPNQWVQLANTNFPIPSGATNLLLYVETESTINFYIDEMVGAPGGTVVGLPSFTTPATTPATTVTAATSPVTDPTTTVTTATLPATT